jgi:hypothetical protein
VSSEEGEPSVLLEFGEDLLDVALVGEAVDDLKLGELDVDGVVVLAEEDFDVVLEDERAALDDEVNVAKGDVLHFVARGEESDCGRVKNNQHQAYRRFE